MTPYQFASNNPIQFIDLDGGEAKDPQTNSRGEIVPLPPEVNSDAIKSMGGDASKYQFTYIERDKWTETSGLGGYLYHVTYNNKPVGGIVVSTGGLSQASLKAYYAGKFDAAANSISVSLDEFSPGGSAYDPKTEQMAVNPVLNAYYLTCGTKTAISQYEATKWGTLGSFGELTSGLASTSGLFSKSTGNNKKPNGSSLDINVAPSVSPGRGVARGIKNGHLAGRVHPKTFVPFDEYGFPDFKSNLYSGGVNDVIIKPTGNRLSDFAAANKAAGYATTPKGYTWHHHQSLGRMQLVNSLIHSQTGHTGGFSLWQY